MQVTINGRIIELVEGDITEQDTDAIVNAANQHLQLGSGVAGAIRSKGGPSIQRECDDIGRCPVGDAVITGGGDLTARHVIHAVGPHGGDPDADEMLASATRNSLRVAEQNNLRSISFPAISTGVFGYPIDRCSQIMLRQAIKHFMQPDVQLERIVFCLFGSDAYHVFEQELEHQIAQI
jgi:O-acetyl-ADP-ribose deacetylase (regulator of RNase III)